MDEIKSLCAGTQAMGLPQFLAQANPMMDAVDGAMVRLFGKPQTEAELRADLERFEDEFLARKQLESAK
jgi:hypothetical protein